MAVGDRRKVIPSMSSLKILVMKRTCLASLVLRLNARKGLLYGLLNAILNQTIKFSSENGILRCFVDDR